MEIPFFCDVQAQHRLRNAAHLPPDVIAREHPGEFRSAIIHHGTLAAMFQEIGVSYAFSELAAWEGKVLPFLGRVPDSVIAKCVRVSVRQIGKLRRDKNITKYTKQKALEEIDQ